MKFVYNLNRLSGDGYKMNANNPLVAEPTNITHAQLRYDDYLSPNIIQGEIVGQYGTNSSVLFTVTQSRNDYKLYTSTNGTSYTEDKTFGGNTGVSIGAGIPSYSTYQGLFTQSGIDAPTVVILENTIGNIEWTYNDTGKYLGTLIGAFVDGATVMPQNQARYFNKLSGNEYSLEGYNDTGNSFMLISYDSSNAGKNGLLLNTFIEIRVYP